MMQEQTESELEATEGEEFLDLPVEEEVELANSIAVMDRETFLAEVMPEAISVDGMESAQESSSYVSQFENFISDQGIRHFSPYELLMLGSSNNSGRCAGLNAYPSEGSWRVMAPTARMLDEIRSRLGTPVIIMSGYRNEGYNSCIGGASASQHKRFAAFDFVARGGAVADWWRVAREVRGIEDSFVGGIGKYNSFVHIDTRGRLADW